MEDEEPITDPVVERARAGEEAAIEELLQRHLPRLRGFVRLKVGEELRAKESTSDLVQSVCREVLTRIDRFDSSSEASFRSWLYTTATRKILDRVDYYRAAKRDVRREQKPQGGGDDSSAGLFDVYSSFCTPSRELMSREAIAGVESAFDRLSAEDRELVVLARVVGLSRPEMARKLGKSEGAVRTGLSRALARLAGFLGSEGDESKSSGRG